MPANGRWDLIRRLKVKQVRRRKNCYLKMLLFRDAGTIYTVSLAVSYTPNCRRQRHLAYRIWRRVIISCSSRALNQFHALVKVMAERMWNRRVGNFTIILHTCKSSSPKLSPIWPPHAISRHRVMYD